MTQEAWTWVLLAVGLLSLILGVLSEVMHRAQKHARRAPTPRPGEVLGVKEDVVRLVLGQNNGGAQ